MHGRYMHLPLLDDTYIVLTKSAHWMYVSIMYSLHVLHYKLMNLCEYMFCLFWYICRFNKCVKIRKHRY